MTRHNDRCSLRVLLKGIGQCCSHGEGIILFRKVSYYEVDYDLISNSDKSSEE